MVDGRWLVVVGWFSVWLVGIGLCSMNSFRWLFGKG